MDAKMTRHYAIHVVPLEEYANLRIGDDYLGGTVVDGLGHEEDCLIVTVRETIEIPPGWRIGLYGSNAIACHRDHPPRMIETSKAYSTPFEDWPVLKAMHEMPLEQLMITGPYFRG